MLEKYFLEKKLKLFEIEIKKKLKLFEICIAKQNLDKWQFECQCKFKHEYRNIISILCMSIKLRLKNNLDKDDSSCN